MKPEFDLRRLEEIPDPFAGDVQTSSLAFETLPPAPTRRELRTRRALAAVGALSYEALLVAMMGVRPDLSDVPRSALVLGLAAPLIAARLALSIGARSGPRGVGLPAGHVAAFLLLPLASFVLGALLSQKTARVVPDDMFWSANFVCITGIMMLALGPLVLAVVAYRRSFAAVARWRTAALGVASGAFAAAAMELSCPLDGRLHVLVGHGTPLVVGGLVGLALARFTRI